MLRSMTAYVRREKNVNGSKFVLELKSVNHRALEVVYHLPPGFAFLEEVFKKEIETRIKRGHINCFFTIAPLALEKVIFNRHLAKEYLDALSQLNKYLGLGNSIGIEQIIHFPGILSSHIEEREKHKIQAQALSLIRNTVSELVLKKDKEGRAIFKDIRKHLLTIEKAVGRVNKEIPKVIKDKKKKIADAIELAAALKECDINEEIQRIEFHVRNFKDTLGKITKDVSKGKELDFVVQELQREANTTAAKAATNTISYLAVKAKAAIEKMREQLQNVE